MHQIRPVSDLRNNFAEISRIVHEEKQPVIMTRNGHGDMVVMSYEHYEEMLDEYFMLKQQVSQLTQRQNPWGGSMESVLNKLENLVQRIEEKQEYACLINFSQNP